LIGARCGDHRHMAPQGAILTLIGLTGAHRQSTVFSKPRTQRPNGARARSGCGQTLKGQDDTGPTDVFIGAHVSSNRENAHASHCHIGTAPGWHEFHEFTSEGARSCHSLWACNSLRRVAVVFRPYVPSAMRAAVRAGLCTADSLQLLGRTETNLRGMAMHRNSASAGTPKAVTSTSARPVPQFRPVATKDGRRFNHTYTPTRTREFEAALRARAQDGNRRAEFAARATTGRSKPDPDRTGAPCTEGMGRPVRPGKPLEPGKGPRSPGGPPWEDVDPAPGYSMAGTQSGQICSSRSGNPRAKMPG
jgi:hypothetical protein